jgi:hypothetical protein
MFGVIPAPEPGRLVRETTVTYQAGIVGALLFGLGLVCLTLAIGLSAQLIGSWLSILIIGLPLMAGSALGLALGYANLHTRIELGPEGVQLVAPTWRGVPVPPLQHLSVHWDEIRTLRRRTEWQGSRLLRLRLPVDVHAVETADRRVVLASYYLGELEPVLLEIMTRSGCARVDDGDVDGAILPSLLRGSAAWTETPGATSAIEGGVRPPG